MPSPLWDSRGTSDPRGEEVFDWVISSDLIPLNDPDTPTLLHCSTGSRSSPDISFAPSSLAFFCSWEVLQDLGSDHLPIVLSVPLSPVFLPNERPPSFNFQKARWDDFASYFDSHCPSAEKYSSLSLSSAAALFTSLTLNVAKSSIPFGRIKRPPKAWWSAEVEQAVSERCKAFAAAHRSDEDRQAYISASRRASSVIAKAKTEAWQTTCSSLSPKSNPKFVHSLLRSIAGSPSWSSFSLNCSSPRESASVCAAYLRSYFSVSQPKALRRRARGYLTELRRVTCLEESHSSFCSPFSLAEFLTKLNCLHPFLKFTFEKEKGKCLSFLDVYVERTDVGLGTSVYCKPTFTGQYLRWESFSPLKRKISLISTLVHRTLMICTKRRLNEEIERIKKILLDNGYPKNIINTQITKKIAQFSTLKRFGPEKCPVYLRVPWIGKPSTNLEKEVKTAMESCYGSVSTRLVFTSKRMLPVARKDVLPAI